MKRRWMFWRIPLLCAVAVICAAGIVVRAPQALPAGEVLQSAAFENVVTQREARVGEMPVELEEAKALIQRGGTLLSTTVVTKKTEIETIPFETETMEDKRIPHGSRIVLQVGRTGQHTVITTSTYQNGKRSGEPLAEESTIAPVSESILVGVYVAETPDGNPGRSEGQRGRAGPEGFPLSLPLDGSITSNFGTRERVMHYGIDIEGKVGDAIAAPGDGLVVFVGVRSSYGLVVEIAHGDGFVSRLAPLGDVAVQVGQEVTRGQQIGTLAAPVDEEQEPHLHFELLIDGLPYNPRQYLA